MLIEIDGFHTGHGEGGRGLSSEEVLGIKFGQIHGCQAGIDMEVQAFFASGLTITESSELFGISKDEFNLETSFVILIDLRGTQLRIRGEQQRVSGMLFVSEIHQIGDAEVSLETDAIDHRRIEMDVLFDLTDILQTTQIIEMDLAIILAMSTSGLLWTIIQIAQIGITAELSDEVEMASDDPFDEFVFGEHPIPHHIANPLWQLGSDVLHMVQIHIHPGFLCFFSGSAFLRGGDRLRGADLLQRRGLSPGERIGGVIGDIYDAKRRDFQPFGGLVMRTVEEGIYPIGLLPTLGKVRAVYDRDFLMSRSNSFGYQNLVESGKIKGVAKLTGKGLLTQRTVATQVSEVHLPAHQQDRGECNHQKLPLGLEHPRHLVQDTLNELHDFLLGWG